ncbi:protein kinase domain-containing protein [Candidatus Uabimicrobium amorphum]|uniref:non-specific serine/threonine protein kinase n=1 Tax=Uabimicrobium amorphum TaxID=2596890 RepID=A0A5S9F279_UABAM|nr:serine/threonine-protein kinase [Candidatus Uabimicrobium amorphum]BBM82833.1 putative serine/threonine-protein kinase [Candidatus Uabimicrobium amorphum]
MDYHNRENVTAADSRAETTKKHSEFFDHLRTQSPIVKGQTFGRYHIERPLGRGGMGVVYKAYDTKLKIPVALKVIANQASHQNQKRFLLEAAATARLDHPNIVRFYEVGEKPQPYIAMEYIEGWTLQQLIHERRLKETHIIDLMIKICEALQHAHKKNILHRDIKPANIMVTAQGQPKIMDFGLAKVRDEDVEKLSQSGQMLGTLLYMSPEQIEGKATIQSDIYSIGATLYEALTLRPVFQGAHYVNIVCQIVDKYPVPPHEFNEKVSAYLEAICLKCLEKKPQKRYNDFRQLTKEFRNLQQQRPILAKRYTKLDAARYFFLKNKILTLAVISVFSILLVAVTFITHAWQQAQDLNVLLMQEKKKTEENLVKLKQEQQQSQVLVNASLKSLKYAAKKSPRLIQDKKFVQPFIKVFQQADRLKTAKELRWLRGAIFGQSNKRRYLEESIKDYNHVIADSPEDVLGYINRANTYRKLGKNEEALKDIAKAMQIDPKRAEPYVFRANIYHRQGKLNEALRDYSVAIELNPSYVDAYAGRGRLYIDKKMYHEALVDHDKALALEPNLAKAYVNRGRLHMMKSNFRQALKDFGDAKALGVKDANLDTTIARLRMLIPKRKK